MYIQWEEKGMPLIEEDFASPSVRSILSDVLVEKKVYAPVSCTLLPKVCDDLIAPKELEKNIRIILKGVDFEEAFLHQDRLKNLRTLFLKKNFSPEVMKELGLVFEKLSSFSSRHKAKEKAVLQGTVSIVLSDRNIFRKEVTLALDSKALFIASIKRAYAEIFSISALMSVEGKGLVGEKRISLVIQLIPEMGRPMKGLRAVVRTYDSRSGSKRIIEIEVQKNKQNSVVQRICVIKDTLSSSYPCIVASEAGQSKWILSREEVQKLALCARSFEEKTNQQWKIDCVANAEGAWYVTRLQPLSERKMSLEQATQTDFRFVDTMVTPIALGRKIGRQIGQGPVRVVASPAHYRLVSPGEVVVARVLAPGCAAALSRAAAVILEDADKNGYGALVCEASRIPTVFGVARATKLFKNGEEVTVSCAGREEGAIYKGAIPFENCTLAPVRSNALRLVGMELINPLESPSFSEGVAGGMIVLNPEFIYQVLLKTTSEALVQQVASKKNKSGWTHIGNADQSAFFRLVDIIAYVTHFFPEQKIVVPLTLKKNSTTLLTLYAQMLVYLKKVYGLSKSIGVALRLEVSDTSLQSAREIFTKAGLSEEESPFYLQHEQGVETESLSLENLSLVQGVIVGFDAVLHYGEKIKNTIRQLIRRIHQAKKVVIVQGDAALENSDVIEFLCQEKIDGFITPSYGTSALKNMLSRVEKKIGFSFNSFSAAVLSKALSVAGFVGLVVSLAGYTCASSPAASLPSQAAVQSAVALEVSKLKVELRQEIMNELKQEPVEVAYQEDGFAYFSLHYPSNWQVTHQLEKTIFSSIKGDSWFSIAREKRGPPPVSSSTLWFGLVSVAHAPTIITSSSYNELLVYPADKKDKTMLVIRGDPEHFSQFISNISSFRFKSKN